MCGAVLLPKHTHTNATPLSAKGLTCIHGKITFPREIDLLAYTDKIKDSPYGDPTVASFV